MENKGKALLNVLWTNLKLSQMCTYDTLSGYIEKEQIVTTIKVPELQGRLLEVDALD